MMAERCTWHLADEALLAFLDGTLEAAALAEAQAHLAACAHCREREQYWRSLFARMEHLREVPHAPDLSQAVIGRIRSSRISARAVRVLLYGELALGLVAVAVLSLGGWGALAAPPQLPPLPLARWIGSLAVAWRPVIDWLQALPLRASALELRLPSLDMPLAGWAALLGGALILGLIGNSLLLRTEPRAGSSTGRADGRR